jgi:hypothetical protein
VSDFPAGVRRLGLVHLGGEADVAGVQPGEEDEAPGHGGAAESVALSGEAGGQVALGRLAGLVVRVDLSIVDVDVAVDHGSHTAHHGSAHRQFPRCPVSAVCGVRKGSFDSP